MVDEIVVISQNAIGIRRFVLQMERWSQTVLGHFFFRFYRPFALSFPHHSSFLSVCPV